MALPILQSNRDPTADDLVRYYHRTELHWSRHVAEEATLDAGTAMTNPELATVEHANRVLDMSLPEGMTPAEAVASVDEHFASCGVSCRRWVLAPSAHPARTRPLADYFAASHWKAHAFDIWHLTRPASVVPAESPGLTIIPARASFRHARALAEEIARCVAAPEIADAEMLHVDDPSCDALLALKDGQAAGQVAVLSVGDIGCIENVFVSEPFRRQGIGRTLVARAMEICARSLFKHVFIGVEPANAPAVRLYSAFGFRRVGSFIEHERPAQARP